MTKEELLKEIMKLPKVETNNPISTMTGINIDDLMNAVDRLNKVPDYNDLLKENQELKKQLEDVLNENRKLRKNLENCMTFEEYEYTLHKKVQLRNQQKEFIKYLEDNWKQTQDIWYIKILQKYKEIIGE